MITIMREVRFESAHCLPNYEGKCKNLHGHQWILKVYITAENLIRVGSKVGMIMDFKDLDRIITDEVVSKLDHRYINDIIDNPTAENMLLWIYDRLKYCITANSVNSCRVTKIELYETSDSCAILEVSDVI